MSGYKLNRITTDLKRELADLFRSLKDPRVGGMLSIVKVDVSGDLSCAKIYVSALEGAEQTKQAVAGLTSASGFLRRELLHRMSLRKMPELRFIADDSIAHSAKISKIIESFDREGE